LWDISTKSGIAQYFDHYRKLMLPGI
jgi:hypothetical protein